jgi:hypothetical protein
MQNQQLVENKRISTCSSYESYPHQKKEHSLYVDYDTYMKINRLAGDKIVEKLVMTGKSVTLPSRLGIFQLMSFKPKENKKIDFKLTKEYGKTIYHRNIATDGYVARLHWSKNRGNANFKNKQTWAFKLTRSQQRYKENSIVKYIQRFGLKHLIKQ